MSLNSNNLHEDILDVIGKKDSSKKIEELLFFKPDLNIKFNNEYCFLFQCAFKSDYDAFCLMLKNGADPNIKCSNGCGLLHILVSIRLENKEQWISHYLKHGGDINAVDENNETALWMIPENDTGLIINLIGKGADLSIKNNKDVSLYDLYKNRDRACWSIILHSFNFSYNKQSSFKSV